MNHSDLSPQERFAAAIYLLRDAADELARADLARLPADRGPDDRRLEDLPPVAAPKSLAAYLGTTVSTLERWREAKTGPAFHRLPGARMIRYTRADVLEWLADCRVATRSPA